jgi:RNA polymerase sigma-70 factor (ECF subfamily)
VWEPSDWTSRSFYRRSKDECLFAVLVSVGDQDIGQDLVAEAFARAWASWRAVVLAGS